MEKAPLTQPSQSPSGMATSTASENPTPTRINEAPMCMNRVPSLISSAVPVTTCQGVGKITLWVAATIVHHAASRIEMTAIAGRLSLILFI